MEPRNCSGSHRGGCDAAPVCARIARTIIATITLFCHLAGSQTRLACSFRVSRADLEYPRKRARLSFLARSTARLISLISLFRGSRMNTATRDGTIRRLSASCSLTPSLSPLSLSPLSFVRIGALSAGGSAAGIRKPRRVRGPPRSSVKVGV